MFKLLSERRAATARGPHWRAGCLALAATFLASGAMGQSPVSNRVHIDHVDYDRVHLTVLEQGRGPAVVMIPSLGRGAEDFDDLAARVAAAGYRVLRLQPRGVGDSRGPEGKVTLKDFADDVAHVISASGAQRAAILGHADGNRTARATAAYYPDRVSCVVLLAGGGKTPVTEEMKKTLFTVLDLSLPDKVRLPQIATGFFAPGHDPSVWRSGWYPHAAKLEVAANSATPLKDWWTAGRAPVLEIAGEDDYFAPPQNAELLAKDIGSRATIVRLRNAGHAMLPEQPKEVARIVIDFLNHHTGAAG